jgi:hypothetical protein
MNRISNPARAKRRVAIDAAMILIIILLITQMWLLTATLESYLAGHREVALPGMLLSAVLFLASAALYWFVIRLDRSPGPEELPQEAQGPWHIG